MTARRTFWLSMTFLVCLTTIILAIAAPESLNTCLPTTPTTHNEARK